ncbi:MAG TPA: PEGA domain-containing protein, partial [Patescibacteria group bacterium]|nr:PEGA domain-containing protein [Patescibacteria group bacterium]
MRKHLLTSFVILLFLIAGTILVVLYGRGYRINLQDGKPDVSKTGILAAKSQPDGAQVYIDGDLTAATNENINLTPGEYTVRIVKDGYFSWEKHIAITEEVVTYADAYLFPTAPKLESITSTGIKNPILDPTKTKLAYTIASQSAQKNGIYVYDMAANPVIAFQGAARQIADDTVALMSESVLSWSANGAFVIASVSSELGEGQQTFQLEANSFNENPQDISETLSIFVAEETQRKLEEDRSRRSGLRRELRSLLQNHFRIISWSPDSTKILYQATTSATLPLVIKPRIPGIHTLTEERILNKDAVYVYNISEDANYKLLDGLPENCNLIKGDCVLPLLWFPTSKHLLHVHDRRIDIVESDGGNRTTLYAGPFVDTYVFPWPNGSRFVILAN